MEHKCIQVDEMNKAKLELNTIKFNMQKMQEDITEIKDMLKGLEKKMDERYAGKWVERPMIWAMTMIGTAFLGALISLVIIQYK